MKIFLALFMFIATTAIAQQPEWYRLDSDLLKVSCIGKTSVYALGTNGCLLRSVDNGGTWKQIPTLIQNSLLGISFADSLHGTAIATAGKAISTTDGGISWKLKIMPELTNLRSIVFRGMIGIIVGDGGTIFRSNDGGNSWSKVQSSIKINLYSTAFISDTTAIIGGQFGYLFCSHNAGVSWTVIDTLPGGFPIIDISIAINSNSIAISNGATIFRSSGIGKKWNETSFIFKIEGISFPKPNIGFVIGSNLSMYKTIDSGETFSLFDKYDSTLIASKADFTSIAFSDELCGVAVGTKKTIYRTIDAGNHWELVSYLNQEFYWLAAQFVSEDIGFASGGGTEVYRTKDGGATWLSQRKSTIKTSTSINALHFFNPKDGIIFPDLDRNLHRTTDGGETYVSELMPYPNSYSNIHFPNQTLGVLTNQFTNTSPNYSTFSTTTDAGKTWKEKRLDSMSLGYVFCINKDLSYSTGYLPYIPKSFKNIPAFHRIINGGDSVERITMPKYTYAALGMHFFDENNGFVGGRDTLVRQMILRTRDGGHTWTFADTTRYNYDTQINKLIFADNLHGYAVGYPGLILTTSDGGNSWKQSITPEASSPINLSRITSVDKDIVYIFGSFSVGESGGVILKKLPISLLNDVNQSTIADGTVPPTVWVSSPRPLPSIGKIILDAIWVQNLDISTIRIKLYDMLGVELRDITDGFHPSSGTNTGTIEFDGSSFPTGIYYVEITGGGRRKAVPIVIAK